MSREQWGHGYWNGVSDGLTARLDFKSYCMMQRERKDRDDAILDFVYDVGRDKDFPKQKRGERKSSYKRRIWKHMHGASNGRFLHPCREAEIAFMQLWNEWISLWT